MHNAYDHLNLHKARLHLHKARLHLHLPMVTVVRKAVVTTTSKSVTEVCFIYLSLRFRWLCQLLSLSLFCVVYLICLPSGSKHGDKSVRERESKDKYKEKRQKQDSPREKFLTEEG